ncbi:MAG: hypothetical protein OEU95_08485, partial [Nitrospirota bacterium]|nr:hypothetical protein [Nitrospirota bacterium]
GVISSLVLFGIQSMIALKGPEILPSVTAVMVFLPLQMYLSVPVLGAVMSLMGCFIAVGKIKY